MPKEFLTEQAYIDVRDLSNILNADAILRDITVDSQPIIAKDEYQMVMKTLLKWKESLFDKIQADRDATDDMLDVE